MSVGRSVRCYAVSCYRRLTPFFTLSTSFVFLNSAKKEKEGKGETEDVLFGFYVRATYVRVQGTSPSVYYYSTRPMQRPSYLYDKKAALQQNCSQVERATLDRSWHCRRSSSIVQQKGWMDQIRQSKKVLVSYEKDDILSARPKHTGLHLKRSPRSFR